MGRFVRAAVVVLTLGSAVCAEEELARRQECSATDDASCEVSPAIPVIDISPLMRSNDHSAAEWDAAAEAVARACEEWGFFQVRCLCVGEPLWRSISVLSPFVDATEGRRSAFVVREYLTDKNMSCGGYLQNPSFLYCCGLEHRPHQ